MWMKFIGNIKKFIKKALFLKKKRDGWAEKQMREMAKLGAKLVL